MKGLLFWMIGILLLSLSLAGWSQVQSSILDTGQEEPEGVSVEIYPTPDTVADPWNLNPPGDPFAEDVNPSALSLLPGNVSPSVEPQIFLAEERPVVGGFSTPALEPKAIAPLTRPNYDRWTLEITPYMWAPAVQGFLKVNDRGSDYDLENRDDVNLMDEVKAMAPYMDSSCFLSLHLQPSWRECIAASPLWRPFLGSTIS